MWKLKYQLKQYWKITIRDTLSPLFEKDKIFSFLTVPIFLLISFKAGDIKDDFNDLGKTSTAIALTIPFWFFLNLCLSPFRFYKEERELGSWEKDKFNYNTPQLVYTTHIYPKDNSPPYTKIRITNAEPNSFCNFKIVCDGGISQATISLHENNTHFFGHFDRTDHRVGIRINDKKETKVIFNRPENSDQTTVRFYLLSWEKTESKPLS